MKRGGRQHSWSSTELHPQGIVSINRCGCIPPPCRTLADMTWAEIQAIEREYGAPVLPWTPRK